MSSSEVHLQSQKVCSFNTSAISYYRIKVPYHIPKKKKKNPIFYKKDYSVIKQESLSLSLNLYLIPRKPEN